MLNNKSIKPYISVVINCYDRKKFLKLAIYSAINQDLDRNKYEIVVITNFKWETEKKFRNKIKFIFYEEKAMSKRLNRAIKDCEGKVIVTLDDDDLFETNKLSYIYTLFKSDKNLGYYHNSYNVINDKNKAADYHLTRQRDEIDKIGSIYVNKNSKKKYFMKMIRLACDFNSSCQAVRKDILIKHLDTPLLRAQDSLIFYIAYLSKFSMLSDPNRLTRYRVWDKNISRSTGNTKKLLDFSKSNADLYKYLKSILPKTKNNYSLVKYIDYNILHHTLLSDMLGQNNRIKVMKDFLPYLLYVGPLFSNFRRLRLDFVVILYLINPKIIDLIISYM